MILCTEFSGSKLMNGAKKKRGGGTEKGFEWLGLFEVLNNKFYFTKCMKTFT